MSYALSENERRYLRDLAGRQAGIAALPVMEQRRRMWTDMNDGKSGARPPFVIETWTFDRDFMPDSIFRCQSEYGRRLEGSLLRNIRQQLLTLPNLTIVLAGHGKSTTIGAQKDHNPFFAK